MDKNFAFVVRHNSASKQSFPFGKGAGVSCVLFLITLTIAGYLMPAEGFLPPRSWMEVVEDPSSGQFVIRENGSRVLQYNYRRVEPGDVLQSVKPENLKYARPRSNYIHPLYGFEGEELTRDWSVDHPHHRGIYWAWPEVQFGGEMGDLHALQRVFARPTGEYELRGEDTFGQIKAENLWKWDDQVPIVREWAVIRAYRTLPNGRFVDLEFHFTPLVESVSLARRQMHLYGGLNVRLSPVEGQEIIFHTDSDSVIPRMAWAELSGVFRGSRSQTGISILQHPDNPDYPGDWVKYPELNWFQPTFPAAGTRYPLKQNQTLVLRFRLWIHRGKMDAEAHTAAWSNYRETSALWRAE